MWKQRMLALSMALLLLVGNMGLSLATHYCCGEAVERALSLGMAEVGCGMEKTRAKCPQKGAILQKQSCCDDQVQHLRTDDGQRQSCSLPAASIAGYITVNQGVFLPITPWTKPVWSAPACPDPPPLSARHSLFSLVQSFLL